MAKDGDGAGGGMDRDWRAGRRWRAWPGVAVGKATRKSPTRSTVTVVFEAHQKAGQVRPRRRSSVAALGALRSARCIRMVGVTMLPAGRVPPACFGRSWTSSEASRSLTAATELSTCDGQGCAG